MARGRKQKLKLFYLYKVFRENSDKTHPLTMPQIVELLASYGVDSNRKALYDDIEALKLFGIDIEKKRVGGHTYYYATNRPFELAEMKILIDAVQASKFISEKETKVLIQKLLFLVGENDAGLLERDVHVPGRIKNMSDSVYHAVDVIFRAQELDHQLRFHYFRWDLQGKKQLRRNGEYYKVSPWNLIYDDEKYYLVGYDHLHKEIRHYRVDKMLDVEELDLKRKGITKYRQVNKGKYTQQHFRMYGGEMQTVTLRCKNEMANVIIDQFGRGIQINPVDMEHFMTEVDVAVSDQFLGWVIALGEGVKIVGPTGVLEEVKRFVERARKQYK